MPEEPLLAEMGAYHEDLQRAGVRVDGAGLQASSKGWRIRYAGGSRTVLDGPFPLTPDMMAGYTLIDVKSRGEALEWSKRYPNLAGRGNECEIEERHLFDVNDFESSAAIDRMRVMSSRD